MGLAGALKDEGFEKTEVWTMKNEKQHLQSGKHRKETLGAWVTSVRKREGESKNTRMATKGSQGQDQGEEKI